MFFAGSGLFLLGPTLCGFAWGMVPLIAFRALQGFGAGGVQTLASTILGDIYTPVERGRVQGMVSSVFGVSAVAGPSLGAFLIEHVSWQAVFWVNLPIAPPPSPCSPCSSTRPLSTASTASTSWARSCCSWRSAR